MAKKILVTDDDRDLVEALNTRFKSEGYEVVTAYNGEECLRKAKENCPDLIIMDVAMPVMDGYTVVTKMKEDEDLSHIPVIILTGKDQMEEIFMVEGVKEYVVKPFDFKDLTGMVKKIFNEG